MDQLVKDDYKKFNRTVREGITFFVNVGNALAQIRDRKLFKVGGYTTFEDYCQSEHSFSSNRGRRMIAAAAIGEKFELNNERQARELAKVPEEDRDVVIKMAKDRQADVTSSMIQDMHTEVISKRQPNDQKLEEFSIDTTVFDEFDAAVTKAGQLLNQLVETVGGAYVQRDVPRADLKSALSYVRNQRPTHRCFACQGRGCKVCKNTGMVSKIMWDNRPVEFV